MIRTSLYNLLTFTYPAIPNMVKYLISPIEKGGKVKEMDLQLDLSIGIMYDNFF